MNSKSILREKSLEIMQHLPLQDTVMQKAVADIVNALKTVVEVSAAAALHVDTT